MVAQGFFQAIDAEHRFHAVADPPTENPTRVPVDDRHPVGETSRQPDVRDVRAPNLVGSDDWDAAQQVGVNLVFRVWAAGVRTRRHAGQAHLPHQVLYPLAIDDVARHLEKHNHLAAAVKRAPRVLFVDQTAEQQIAFIDQFRFVLCIDRGAGDPGQNALLDDADWRLWADPGLPRHGRLIPDFF